MLLAVFLVVGCSAVAFMAGRMWPMKVRNMPSFLVRVRTDLMRRQTKTPEELWVSISGLIGNPAFQSVVGQLYEAHVWMADQRPSSGPHEAAIREGLRKSVVDFCTIMATAEQAMKERAEQAMKENDDADTEGIAPWGNA